MPENETAPVGEHRSREQSASSGNERGDYSLLARWRVVGVAARDAGLARSDVAVLIAILDHINTARGDAWPSVDTIAIEAGVDRSTATRSIARLVGNGHLIRERGEGRTCNTYRMPDRSGCNAAPTRRTPSRRSVAPTTESCGRDEQTVVGAHGARSGCEPAPRTCVNHQKENHKQHGASAPRSAKENFQAKQEELDRITREAIAAYNDILAKPNGKLDVVRTDVGLRDRARQIKQCLPAARDMCRVLFKNDEVTAKFWASYFESVRANVFLSGYEKNIDRQWRPSFAYLIKPATMLGVFDSEVSPT